MKRLFLCLLFTVFAFGATAQNDQPDVLFSRIDRVGGFGGPLFHFTNIDGEAAFMTGGGGAAIFNRRFYIGGYGMGLSSNTDIDVNGASRRLDFGHGGFWLGYIIKPNSIVHLNLQSQLGWGGVSFRETQSFPRTQEDGVFVINPMAEIELNVARWMRVGLAGGYRMVTGVGLEGLDNDALNGGNVQLAFKFGWF
ncbi:MAG: hypothetical protein AAF740_00890 [Bacteroidota bacterium]